MTFKTSKELQINLDILNGDVCVFGMATTVICSSISFPLSLSLTNKSQNQLKIIINCMFFIYFHSNINMITYPDLMLKIISKLNK